MFKCVVMQMMFFQGRKSSSIKYVLSTSQISKVPSNFPQLCKKDIGGTKILMLVYFYACDELASHFLGKQH